MGIVMGILGEKIIFGYFGDVRWFLMQELLSAPTVLHLSVSKCRGKYLINRWQNEETSTLMPTLI